MNKTILGIFVFTCIVMLNTIAGEVVSDPKTKRTNMQKEAMTLPTPKTKEATNVTSSGYTANWEPVKRAQGYAVYSILTHVANTDEVYKVYEESFDKIDLGTLDEPFTELSPLYYLDDYMNTCGWSTQLGVFVRGMVGLNNGYRASTGFSGYLETPKMDLTGDNGKFTMDMKVIPMGVDTMSIGLFDADGDVRIPIEMFDKPVLENGEVHFEFTKGVKRGYLRIIANKEGMLFFDNITISRNLKAGESYTFRRNYLSLSGDSETATPPVSCDFETPGKQDNDGYSFQVCAWIFGATDERSAFSEPRVVSTPVTGINDSEIKDTKVFVDDCLHVNVSVPATIQVYSSTGVCLSSLQTEGGSNRIDLPTRGIYLVQVNDEVYKVIK